MNSKKKRSLKYRVKDFFSINLEEDLQEEESSKKFDKIKLFTLTREYLFIGLLLFMLITNILVEFDLNFLYLRQILGFLFLIIVPGLLVMLCLKIRNINPWEYLVYTVGLSVSFIMFAGLAINWALPWLHITDKPLSLWPILISFDIFLLIFTFIAYLRNKDLTLLSLFPFDEYKREPYSKFRFIPKFPKFTWLDRIFIIIPMFFPFMAVIGAFLLNNHGTNIATMIMLSAIAIYVLMLVLFRDKFNENVYPWAILMISLSLLLSFSIRSWYISGWDISQETYVFRLTIDKGIWSIENFRDAYNSCLSLSILPAIIKLFTSLNIQIIFKLFFQIIFIFHSLTIFLIFRRYILAILAFIASFLYFGTGYFNLWFYALIRQEIAFLFFGLMLLVLFSKEINPTLKRILFIIFGFSMIVSHYSTSYIALALFLFTYTLTFFYKKWENRRIKKGKLKPQDKQEFYLTGLIILFLLMFAFLWLSQLTKASEGLVYTVKTTIDNLGNSFSYDLKQSSIKSALFGNSGTRVYTDKELNDYINETKSFFKSPNSYLEQQTQVYSPKIIGKEIIYSKNRYLISFLFYLYNFIKYSIILSFILGSLFIYLNRKKICDKEFSFMIILSVILMFLIILLPFISKAYNFERLFQQCLIFLSFSSIIFFRKTFKNYEKIFFFFVILVYLGYSLFNLGFLLPLSGGDPTLNLYNRGVVYNTLYSHNQEIISINWFNKNNQTNIVYMDPYSELKFYSFGDPMINKDKKVIPFLMSKSSYVYSNYANKIKKVNYWDAREKFNNGVLPFNFPTEFLNDNKNKIYNNGGSEIFR